MKKTTPLYTFYITQTRSDRNKDVHVAGAFTSGFPNVKTVFDWEPYRSDSTTIVRGVMPPQVGLVNQAIKQGSPYIFVDNGYFLRQSSYNRHSSRGYFRIVKNARQHHWCEASLTPSDRWAQMYAESPMLPWRKDGDFILLCIGSDYVSNAYGFLREDWLRATIIKLREHTDRKIRIRLKPRESSDSQVLSFKKALEGCHAVVTFNSVAAVEAILNGVPAFVAPNVSAAQPVACLDLAMIESPSYSEREPWLYWLAYQQWTAAEISSGLAYEHFKRMEPTCPDVPGP